MDMKNRPPPIPPKPPPVRLINDSLDLPHIIWPRTAREEAIFKQGASQERDEFNWYCAGIGFAVASLFWGVCFHLWGG